MIKMQILYEENFWKELKKKENLLCRPTKLLSMVLTQRNFHLLEEYHKYMIKKKPWLMKIDIKFHDHWNQNVLQTFIFWLIKFNL